MKTQLFSFIVFFRGPFNSHALALSLVLARSLALALLLTRTLSISRSLSFFSLYFSLSLCYSDTTYFMQQLMLTQEVSSINTPCHIMSLLGMVAMFKRVFCSQYHVWHLSWAAEGRDLL